MKLALGKPRLLLDMGQLWVAATLANILFYLFQLVVGRSLGPEDYGLFGALFGIVYFAGAFSNGVRTTVAKFVAESQAAGGIGSGPLVSSAMLRMVMLGAGVLFLFGLGSPLIGAYLHTTSVTPILVTGAVIAVSFLWPVLHGALQGNQRFLLFSAALILFAGSRLALGGAGLAMNLGITGVLAAIGLSSLMAMALGLAILRPPLSLTLRVLPAGALAKVLIPTAIGSFAIAFLTSVDVIIVRHWFSPVEAGLYTGAAVLGRVVLLLPTGVTVVLFPKIAQEWAFGNSGRGLLYKGLGLTALVSGGACLGFVIFPDLTLSLLLGSEYSSAAGLVPLYAATMFFFSLAIVYLYYHLATGQMAYVYLVLIPHLLLEVTLINVFHQSLTQVVLVLLFVNLSLAALSHVFTQVTPVRVSIGLRTSQSR